MEGLTRESRRFPRIKFSGPLRCTIRGSTGTADTVAENLSVSGVGFVSPSFIAPHTAVMLQIQLLSQIIQPIARIVWSSPFPRQNRFHLGAQFLEWDPKDKKHLSEFLSFQAHQPR